MADQQERTYHTDTTSPYNLPNDAIEHARLDKQGYVIDTFILRNRTVHAPLDPSTTTLIIDVGCGTGAKTDLIARKYPSARVIGIDLSPVPSVPRPPNASYKQGNILHTPSPFDPASADYITSRLLWPGMNDWPAYIASAFDILKPGGYLELQESQLSFWTDNGAVLPDAHWKYLRKWKATLRAKGLDQDIALHAAGYMRAAGFEDIRMVEYKLPLGKLEPRCAGDVEWPDLMRDLKRSGSSQRVDGEGWSEEEIKGMAEEFGEYVGEVDGRYNKFYVILGWKPTD